MKTIFWNVGKHTADSTKDYVEMLVAEHAPALICLAEGPGSHQTIYDLIDWLARLGYYCYYSPVAYLTDSTLPPRWNATGLKVFVQTNQALIEPFDFTHIRRDGRIVVIKPQLPASPTAIVFLHGKAKEGSKDWTASQAAFLKDLKVLLEESGQIEPDERVAIIGDFNLEPWDELLRHEDYFNTCFTPKQRQLIRQQPKATRVFYNPVLETVWNSAEPNLAGTYYSNSVGWALLDYVLYAVDETGISYEIVTSLSNGTDLLPLLTADVQAYRNFFSSGVDHLPILIQFK